MFSCYEEILLKCLDERIFIMRKFLLYALIGLAVIGLGSQLIFNPSQLIKTTALVILGAIVFYLIFRFLFRNRFGSDEMRKYRQAVKQSKLKYQKSTHNQGNFVQNKKPLRKRAPHLRVIEGRKQK